MSSISTAIDASARARALGIKTTYKNMQGGKVAILPQRIAVVGQGSTAVTYSLEKRQVTSATEAGSLYGYGSPVHLAVKNLLPPNGDGVGSIPVTVYPLKDAATAVASEGSISITGTQTESAEYRVTINGIKSEKFIISTGEVAATVMPKIASAINAALDMPVTATYTATEVTVVSKWKGTSANAIHLAVEGSTSAGTVFALENPQGGLLNPTVGGALDQFGSVWETMIVNCLNASDTDALTAFSDFGMTRWGSLVRKPLVVFTGATVATVSEAIAITQNRKSDRTNVLLTSPASTDLPFSVCSREVSRIAKQADENPPCDYGSLQATGLNPGADAYQWLYLDRDRAVKNGVSTIEVRDGVVTLQDIVTFYHPEGDTTPAYSYVCDIVKLQNIIYNIDLIFNNVEWDGAPLIPDDQPTVNPRAKQPKMAVAAVCSKLDALGLEAILSDVSFSKANTFAQISDQNPKRLDVKTTVLLSGNTNIISVDLDFGFFFGTAALVG